MIAIPTSLADLIPGARTLKRVLAAAGAALLVTSCVVHSLEQRGANKLIAKSQIEGTKANVKNATIRDRARTPGAAERMRREACRDCD